MSSILKALKKLEEEKAARLSGQVEISRKILTERTPRTSRRPMLPVIGGALLLTLLILGVSISFWRGSGRTPSAPLQAQAPQQPARPAPGEPLPRQAEPAAAAPASVTNRTQPAALPSPPPLPTPRAQRVHEPAPAPVREAALPPVARPAPQAAPQPPMETTARPASVTAPPQHHTAPALHVSGIAWQKDSASRLAIVNGQPVGLGTAVSGATVDEIFPDLVRFTYKGEKIEVGLGKSSKGD